jgi:predicted dehydrogenase
MSVKRIRTVLIGCGMVGRMDDLHVVLQLESGALATLSCGYRDAQRRTTERCELLGATGGIIVDDATCSVRSFADDPDHFLAGNAFYESLRRHLSDFLTRLSQGEPPAVDGQDAVWATRLAEAAQRSHAQQKDVFP